VQSKDQPLFARLNCTAASALHVGTMLKLVLIFAASYLLGSIPFGYLLVRIFRGEDVRRSGSGNIGATNVSRRSPALGALTLILDALKGTCAVGFAYLLFARTTHRYFDLSLYTMMSVAAVSAVVGHMFPVWLGFRGGKGVATSVGAFAPLVPYPVLGAFAIFVVVTLGSRYVSLGSIAAAVSLPVLAWLFFSHHGDSSLMILPIAVVSLLVIAKHYENILRLLAGTEHSFGSKNAGQSGERSSQ
jgi:glycerol-3-phosphate acyltransferase PlsY